MSRTRCWCLGLLLAAWSTAPAADERWPSPIWAFRADGAVMAPARPLLDWLHLSYKWDQSAAKLLVIGKICAHDLDSNLATQLHVGAAIDRRHAALTQQLVDRITTCEHALGTLGGGLRHLLLLFVAD